MDFEVLEDIGTGKGMLSSVKLINKEEYGGKVVLKIPGCDGVKERLLIDDNMFATLHNTEVTAYTILQNHPEKTTSYPRVHEMERMDLTADPIKKGHIIMEYVPGITHLYCTDYLKPDELIEPLITLARFHSIGADLTKEEGECVPRDFVKNWFTKLFSQANKDLFLSRWKDLKCWLTSDVAKETIGKLDGLLTPEIFEKLNNDCEISGVKEMLCHGDYSFHNLLYRKNCNGSFQFIGVVDFQSLNWGNVAQDLARLFVTALGGKDRRDREQDLLRLYYAELSSVTEQNPPFTFEQLQQSYKRFFQLHGAIVCAVTPGLFLRSLAEKEDGPEKDSFRAKMMEKYQALLEDLHRNMNL